MAGSRYFRNWPNRFTGSNLTIPADRGHAFLTGSSTISIGGFGMTGGSATDHAIPYTLAGSARSESATNGSLVAGHYVVFGKTINVSNTGVINLRGAGIPTTVIFGTHIYFINCTINFGSTASPITSDFAFVSAMYNGGIAEYLVESNGNLGAARIGSNGNSAQSNTLNYINCSVNIYYNGTGAASTNNSQIYFACNDLIHSNVSVIGNTFNASTIPGGLVLLSGGCVYGSTLDCTNFRGVGSAQYSASNLSPVQFSNTAYNALTNSPSLVSGLTPLSLNNAGYKPQAFFGNSASGGPTFGGQIAVNLATIQGVNQNAVAPSGTVVAAGSGIVGSPVFTQADDQANVFMTTVSLDPVTYIQQNMATGAVIDGSDGGFAAVRINQFASADVIIESQTYQPQFYYSPTDSSVSPTTGIGNVQVRANYGFSYGTPAGNASAQSQIRNTSPIGTVNYVSGSDGKISTTSLTDPFNGSASTTLNNSGLRVPYIFYKMNSGQTQPQAAGVNWTTTTFTTPINARHAGAFVNNANISYDVTVQRSNATTNTTGLPFVRSVLSPWRDSAQGYVGPYAAPAASSFLSAANTSNTAIDTYFTGLTSNSWTTQTLGDYVAYRWSVYDTNAAPVNYDSSNLNIGAQNLLLNGALASTSFDTSTQTFNIKANTLTANTANGNASNGGVSTTGNITVNSVFNTFSNNYAPLQASNITYAANSTVLQSVNATSSTTPNLIYPTVGTVINTSGTITGIAGTTSTTGSVTVQGGFKQGSYTGASSNPLAFALGTSSNFTLTGANTLDSGLSVTGGTTGLITLGQTTDTSSSRTTYGANTNLQHTVVLSGSTSGGTVTVNSGNVVGGATFKGGLTVTGYNVYLGSGGDTAGIPKLSVSGQTFVTARAGITVDGLATGVDGNASTNFQFDAQTNANINITRMSIGGSGLKNFLLSDSSTGTISMASSSLGAGSILIRTGGSTCTLSGSSATGQITNDRSGAIIATSGSNLSGGISSTTMTSLTVNGGSSIGATSLTSALTVAVLGDVNGSATITGNTTLKNTALSTVYTINNLVLSANTTLNIGMAPLVSASFNPTIVGNTGSVLRIDAGLVVTGRLTVDASKLSGSFLSTAPGSATLANANGTSGDIIGLINWPAGKAVPTGFLAVTAVNYSIQFSGSTTVPSNIPVEKMFKTDEFGVTSTVTPTRVVSGNTITYSTAGVITDLFGLVVFADGYQPVAIAQQGNRFTASATALPETNIDFTQSTTSETAFINSFTTTQIVPSVGNTRFVMTTNATPAAFPLGRATVDAKFDKLVFRRCMENANSATWHQNIARGLASLPNAYFTFTTVGTSVSSDITKSILVNKANNNTTVIQLGIWNTNSLGSAQYNFNTAGGVVAPNTGTDIIYPIISPGSVALITGQDVQNISNGVNAGLTSSTGALALMSRGIEDASLLIPTTISIGQTP